MYLSSLFTYFVVQFHCRYSKAFDGVPRLLTSAFRIFASSNPHWTMSPLAVTKLLRRSNFFRASSAHGPSWARRSNNSALFYYVAQCACEYRCLSSCSESGRSTSEGRASWVRRYFREHVAVDIARCCPCTSQCCGSRRHHRHPHHLHPEHHKHVYNNTDRHGSS